MMAELLGRFPVREVIFDMPGYMEGLGTGSLAQSSGDRADQKHGQAASIRLRVSEKRQRSSQTEMLIENAEHNGTSIWAPGETALRLDMAAVIFITGS